MAESKIKSLQPLQTTHYVFYANPLYVWFTIFIAFLTILLPWRSAMTPDLLLVVLAFWCAHHARGIGLVAAVIFGFVIDVQDASVLGASSLTYLLVMYCVLFIRDRMMSFNVLGQAIYMLPVFLLCPFFEIVVKAWNAGYWAGWGWLVGALWNTAMWFVVHLILKLPWQPSDDDDAVV